MAQCYLTSQSQECTYIIESSIFSGGSLQGDYLDTLTFIISTGCIVILSTNDGQFYYSSHSVDNSQGIQTWYFIGINNSYIGYIISFNEFAESWDLRSINIPDVSKYLPLTGGTLTGNLTGKHLTGTRLQTTASNHSTSAATKIAIQDEQGWIDYRTAAEIKSDIGVPTKVSDLTNDSGYITDSSLPTKTSQLTNDSGFITDVDSSLSATSTNPVQNKVINTALEGKLALTGGTLTGNLNGKYITGTWLQSTESNHYNNVATKIAIQDPSGWIYHRTAAEIKSDIGVPTNTSQLTNDSGYASETWVTQQIQSAINATWEASY